MKWLSIAICTVIVASDVGVFGQQGPQSQSNGKDLVVMVKGKHEGILTFGAGLIVGRDNSTIYVATAKHVIKPDGVKLDGPQLAFLWAKERWLKAQVLDKEVDGVDLGIVTVDLPADRGAQFTNVRFDRVADMSSVVSRNVYIVGFPDGKPWKQSITGNVLVEESTDDDLQFDSVYIRPGFSGGGVFTDKWELLGMIYGDDMPTGHAVAMQNLFKQTRGWSIPVALRKPERAAINSFISSLPTIQAGGTVILEWQTASTTSCAITPEIGAVESNGTKQVSVSSSTQYVLTCEGPPGGQISKTTTVTVPEPVEILSFALKALADGSSKATWDSKNAVGCVINVLGEVPAKGQQVIPPDFVGSITLTCEGPGGRATKSGAIPNRADVAVPTITIFRASPQRVTAGRAATLGWESRNATGCSIDSGVGDVAISGTTRIAPDQDTEYELVCENATGKARARVAVTVVEPVSISSFVASPKKLMAGKSTVLRWETKNASTCEIDNDVDDVPTHGTKRVSLSETTAYNLTCKDTSGAAATAELEVEVVPGSGNTGAGASQYCCDAVGNRRCVLAAPGIVGTSCGCFGVYGVGYICQ